MQYGSHPENPSDPKSEYVMEYARRIPHPRSGIPAWHWEPKDVRPEEGDALIIIGGRSGLCYPKLFTVEDTRRLLTCKVTILPPGSTIML